MDDRLAQVERGLERLIPRGFSESGRASLDALIDELAAEVSPQAPQAKWPQRVMWGAAAAVTLAAAWSVAVSGGEKRGPAVTQLAEAELEPELMVESENVVAVEEDSAMLADDDGGLHRAWRVTVVNEERFHDPATGHDVRVVHPRDELVLMPVSAF